MRICEFADCLRRIRVGGSEDDVFNLHGPPDSARLSVVIHIHTGFPFGGSGGVLMKLRTQDVVSFPQAGFYVVVDFLAASVANSSQPNAVPAIPQPPSAASVSKTQVRALRRIADDLCNDLCRFSDESFLTGLLRAPG